jgi:hypothetical protein
VVGAVTGDGALTGAPGSGSALEAALGLELVVDMHPPGHEVERLFPFRAKVAIRNSTFHLVSGEQTCPFSPDMRSDQDRFTVRRVP